MYQTRVPEVSSLVTSPRPDVYQQSESGSVLNDQNQLNRVLGTRGTYRPIGLERLRILSSSHIAGQEHQAVYFQLEST